MKLIAGLGNPGKSYANTRHNVGFLCIDYFAKQWGVDQWKMHPVFGEIGEIRHNEEVYFLLKPQTYMNLSGQAIVPCLQYYKGDARKDLIVISDDIDMEFGKVRFRSSGSSGGQNGLKSIIEQLGHQDFQRIKIGIGRHAHMPPSDWVLSKFATEDLESLSQHIFPEVLKCLPVK